MKRELTFETIIVYDTMDNVEMKQSLIRILEEEDIDLLTFTSPSTVKAFVRMVGNDPLVQKVLSIPCVCIGTTTEKTARTFQFNETIVAYTFTIESMVERMIDYIDTEDKT